MNPVVEHLEEYGKTPLPDLIDQIELPRTKVVKICRNTDRIAFEFTEDSGICYHSVKLRWNRDDS